MKSVTQKKRELPAAVLIVGARKFLFSEHARNSGRIAWWDAAKNGEPECVPPGLKTIFVRERLARKKELEKLATAHGAELLEFSDERAIFDAVAALVKCDPDRAHESRSADEEDDLAAPPPAQDLRLNTDRVMDIPVARIRPFNGQPRTYFNSERLRALSRSILRGGQQVPVIVVPVRGDKDHDYQLYDGERRWRACQILKKPTIRAIVAESRSEAEIFKGSAVCNFGREDHTDFEVAQALKRIKESEEIAIDELADLFSRSRAWITQHFSLLRLDPRVQARLAADLPEAERLTYSAALEVSKLPLEHQEPATAHILKHKLGLNGARLYVRKLTAQHGTSSGKYKRIPGDHVKHLRRFIVRSLDDAERMLNPPEFPFHKVVALMPREERREASEKIGQTIAKLKQIQEAMSFQNA